ncbi:MAG TPA: XrtA/PEP-CTERM system TPR-repeat protein PrsT [Burkholderiales bacterium]|nr:XrtA/PEP-CTERM system TPR-repeat protein PrsT [Burkholderiales bacterium]
MIRSNVCCHGALATALLVVVLFSGGCEKKAEDLGRLIAEAKQERDKGNHNVAIIHLKNVLQESPEHAEARYLLGITYNDVGDFASAEWALRKALELRYDQAKVIPALGKSLLMTGEFQKVLDEIRLDGGAGNQMQAEVLTLRAQASIGLDRSSEGRDLLEQALATRPEFVGALLIQAQLAASEKKPNEAAGLIERALASAPKSVEAWLMKGDLSQIMDDRNGATVAYQKVLELSPRNIPARLSIASLQIDSGNFDAARKQIEEIPDSPMAHYVEALIAFRQQNYPDARDEVLQVLAVAPDHLPSMLLAGAIEFALGWHREAQSYLERVMNRAPDNLHARRLLIASLAKSGQVQRALEVLEPGLRQFPEDGALTALAGEVYLQSNEFEKAAQFFEKAALLDPKSAGARTGLGLSRLASGETDHALADLEFASQLDFDKYQADILLVTSYLRQGNYDQALKGMQTLEKKQPDNPLTYNLKAAIYVGKKDTAAARKHLKHALDLQPVYVPAAANLAQLDLQEKNPRAARRRLETILEKDKDNVQALLTLAGLGPRIGAVPKEQIDWLERAHRANPASVQPPLMMARFYAQAGEVNKALEAAQQAQAINPENVDVLDALGAIQMAAGQKLQASVTYRKLATLQPNSPGALYRLATAQAINDEQAAAVSTLRKALSLKPGFIDAQVALADLEVRAGRFQEAMTIARQVQQQAPKSPLGFVLEGDVLMAEEKFSQAVEVYESANSIGKSGLLATKMHKAYAQAGRPDEAERQLALWLKQSPGDAAVRLYAAEASLKSGKYQNAIEHYERLLPKQPDNVMVLNNLAWAYQKVGDKRALATAEHAHRLEPDNAAITDTLGWMLVEQGNNTRGLELLQRAVAMAPQAHEIRYHLAQAWLKTGDTAKARSELERLLANDAKFPQQADAMHLLKQLKN